MGDLYAECLVKKEKTGKDTLLKAGSIAAVVILALFVVLVSPLFMVFAVVAWVLVYFFVFPKTDIEYEYLYVNGELDVDVIMAKSKRKKAKTLEMNHVDIMAPIRSHRLDYYNHNGKLKVLDYSSGNSERNRYAMIVKLDQQTCKVILEPDETMLQMMKKSAPSKVFLD